MKKAITREEDYCDICLKNYSAYKCLECGKDMCYGCLKKHGIEFHQELYISGSSDGHYCKECVAKLSKSKSNPLFNAYVELQECYNEYENWYSNYENRYKAIESRIRELRKGR